MKEVEGCKVFPWTLFAKKEGKKVAEPPDMEKFIINKKSLLRLEKTNIRKGLRFFSLDWIKKKYMFLSNFTLYVAFFHVT